ncbi:MAG: hypothetical protein HDT42_09040 [Ruminococcaceae bacterium]|nr:hypothetical protein [Oscillospiraceae bacterium]
MKKVNSDLERIVALADAEGLTYGKYVAKEHAICTQRRPSALDTVKHCGMSTIQAALPIDCPKLRVVIDESVPNLKGFSAAQVVRLHKQGYNTVAIANLIGCTTREVVSCLKNAGIKIKIQSQANLPDEVIRSIQSTTETRGGARRKGQ